MQCQYEQDHFKCEEDSWRNSNFCILHTDFPDDKDSHIFHVLREEKNKKIKAKVGNEDFDFTGARLFGVDFSGDEINDDLNFSHSKIIENINFNGAKIGGSVYFNGSEIGGTASFDSQHKSFKNPPTKIKGGLNFQGAHIHGGTFFRNIEIGGDLKFYSTKLDSFARFVGANIDGDVWLLDSTLPGIEFHAATIGKFFNVRRSTIGSATFYGTKFVGDVLFKNTSFKEIAMFRRAKFFQNVDFEDVKFIKNVYFDNALFDGIVHFTQKNISSIFGSHVSFIDSSFSDRGIFEGIKNLNASFEGARLKNVVFRDCDLSFVRFKDVVFDNCELSTSKLPEKIIEHREHEYSKRLDFEKLKLSSKMTPLECLILSQSSSPPCLTIIASSDRVKNSKMVADIYRRIRQCLESQGAYIESGEVYKKEMDMRREVYWSENKINWLFYSFLSVISRYGEVSTNLVALILFYYFLVAILVYLLKITPSFPYIVYFNIAIIPIGSFLIALFVYVFARKMSR